MSTLDTFRSELDALKLFLSSQCSVDGAVAKELKDTVAKLEQKFSAESDNEVTLKIKTSGEDSTVVVLKIGLHSTAADLLAKVEDALGHRSRYHTIRLLRTGNVVTEEKTLAFCGVLDRDTLLLETNASSSPSRNSETLSSNSYTEDMETSAHGNSEAFRPFVVCISRSALIPRSPLEGIALAAHALLVEAGFVCISERTNDPNSVPGFAPPLSELPKGQFVPSSWNIDPNGIVMTYKHKSKPGKQFKLMCTAISAKVIAVNFAMKGNKAAPAGVNLTAQEHLETTLLGKHDIPVSQLYINPESLESLLQAVISQVLPASENVPIVSTETRSAISAERRSYAAPSVSTGPRPPSGVPPHPYPPLDRRPMGGGIPSVGRGDVQPPFPGLPGAGGSGQPPLGGPGFGPTPGGGGMLVGPDHPMFGGGGDWDPLGGGVGGGMHPRYDPINPVPGNPLGGRNFGGRGGRGGRGQAARRLPGEPAPDHLRPPDFDDNNDDMYS